MNGKDLCPWHYPHSPPFKPLVVTILAFLLAVFISLIFLKRKHLELDWN